MLRPLYDWLLKQAASNHAPFVLAALAFIEPIILPIPPDLMLAPMVVKRPENIWRYAVLTAVSSVIGGCVSYFIGFWFSDWAVAVIRTIRNPEFTLQPYEAMFAKYGVLFILAKGFLPVPYMIITYAAGALKFSFLQFTIAASVTRGGRFCLTAYLSKRFGPQVLARVEKNLMLWASLFVVVVLAALWVIHKIS